MRGASLHSNELQFGIRWVLYFALSPALMLAFGVVGAAAEAIVITLDVSVVKHRLVARLGLGLKNDDTSIFRFDPEDRAFVREVMVGKLKRFRTRPSEPRPQ